MYRNLIGDFRGKEHFVTEPRKSHALPDHAVPERGDSRLFR
jgi:hypothetical protein